MVANINKNTGIAFGYISARALHDDVVDSLLNDGINESYQEAYKEHKAALIEEGLTEDVIERKMEIFAERWEDYEPTISGEYEGVKYCTSWLGGALNFFIFESPVITEKARLASPCVPNAAILDTLDGSVQGYDVPADWRNNIDG